MPTLVQYYEDYLSSKGAPMAASPIVQLFFCDDNVAAIEEAVFARLGQLVGDLRGGKEACTVAKNLNLRDAIFHVAFTRGRARMNEANLLMMNRAAVERACQMMSPELTAQARYERFRKYGSRPTDIERAQLDPERGDRVEGTRPMHGLMGFRHSPWEVAYGGGAPQMYDHYTRLTTNHQGGILSQRTGSDDLRVQVVPAFSPVRTADRGVAQPRPFISQMSAMHPGKRYVVEASVQLNNRHTNVGPAGPI